mgnify:CR=1 FL=1
MRRVLFGAAALLAAAPAHAELLDARLETQAGQARLWLAFDAQPEAASLTREAGGLSVRIAGVSSAQRRIEPARVPGLDRLALAPEAGGVRVRLTGAFDDASAQVREGGVLVMLSGEGFTASPRLAAVRRARAAGAERADAGSGEAGSGQTGPGQTEPGQTQPGRTEPGSAAAGTAPAPASEPAPDPAPQSAPDSVPVSARESAREAASGDGAPERLWAGVDDAAAAEIGADAPSGPCAHTGAALSDDPWNIEAMTAHAGCLAEADQTGRAAALYARVLAFEPENYDAAMGLGAIRAEAGETDTAQALFQQAAGAARTDGQALRARSAARRAGEGG